MENISIRFTDFRLFSVSSGLTVKNVCLWYKKPDREIDGNISLKHSTKPWRNNQNQIQI